MAKAYPNYDTDNNRDTRLYASCYWQINTNRSQTRGDCRVQAILYIHHPVDVGEKLCKPQRPDRPAESDAACDNEDEDGHTSGGNSAPKSSRDQRDRDQDPELWLE